MYPYWERRCQTNYNCQPRIVVSQFTVMLHVIGFRIDRNVSFMKNKENELRKGEGCTREIKIPGKRVDVGRRRWRWRKLTLEMEMEMKGKTSRCWSQEGDEGSWRFDCVVWYTTLREDDGWRRLDEMVVEGGWLINAVGVDINVGHLREAIKTIINAMQHVSAAFSLAIQWMPRGSP